ncbi:Type II secretion system protein D [Rhodoplanes serenus]|uniref:Type II secretion system protein D n=1 Tax=Rhodoplanes serenus TaxID=200615 RepID=A0A3S5CYL2_9BRAD|nr:type II secretion system secretin GspD [Rhodoplanes serenus]VCU10499.1 Type II secretion system protein D [Rhodoplanes serenus]
MDDRVAARASFRDWTARSISIVIGAVAVAAVLIGCSMPDVPFYRGETRPPDVVESIRRLDIQPRQPTDAGSGSSGMSATPRPVIYPGTEPVTVTQERADGLVGGDVPAGTDGYDLNFEGAPVTTVAKAVLGDILGVGYTIDPRVQGTVTLASGRPIPRSELPFVLENALRMSSVVMVRDASGYRLIPASDALGTGTAETGASAEAGYGITVIPLRHVSAQTALRLLDGFAVRSGAARAEATRNLLLVQGTSSDRRAALDTVLSFDVDWMRGQSVGIYPLRSSTPEPIIAELERIMDSGEGGLSQQLVKLVPVARMNAVMVVTKKPGLLTVAGKWIARLDHSDAATNSLKVYRVRYGNARRIASLLNEIFVGRGGEVDAASPVAPGSGMTAAGTAEGAGGGGTSAGGTGFGASFGRSAGGTVPTGTGSGAGAVSNPIAAGFGALGQGTGSGMTPGGLTIAGGRDPSIIDPASGPLGSGLGGGAVRAGPGILPNVRITADAANNSILIYANQEQYRIIEQTIQQIDRPQRQVAIEGTIAEVTLNDQLNYGVQFFLNSANLGLGPNKGSILQTVGGAVLQRALPGFNLLLGPEAAPRLILDALHQVTDVKVLSNPTLVVLDNQLAILQVGDQVPIATGTATVLTGTTTPPIVNTIDYRNTGVILRVIPRISHNGQVVLDIEQEISNVAPTPSAATLTPTVSQRRVKSSISVASGQTVVLAGLISDESSRNKDGIPVLDALPGIGDAFSSSKNRKKRTELVIFIRPQIIRDSVDAHVIAEQLRAKMGGRVVGDWFPDAVR